MHRRSRGQREYRALIGSAPEEGLAELRLRSPRLYEAVIGAFGGPLAGAELERAARELATVAVLAVSGGAERQLAVHVGAALRAGLAPPVCRDRRRSAGFA
jgi:3-oxoadipate enol-lactonase